jgi:IclR family transcriptional regulator, pca regulon regulatory protein
MTTMSRQRQRNISRPSDVTSTQGLQEKRHVPEAEARKEGMGGLAKGLRILETFVTAKPRLSISEAAASGEMSPAAARRCLLTLEDLGYLSFDGKYFHPTPRMSRLAMGYSNTPLPTIAQAHLDAVRDAADKSASLAVLEDGFAVFVARAEVRELVSATVRLGSRLPAHTSSNGRILLAALDDKALEQELQNLRPALGAKGPLARDKAMVKRRVLEARVAGYSTSDEELEYGVRTLAVPVRDTRGHVHAAMSISAFAHQITIKALIDKHLPLLKAAALKLGNKL